MALTTAVLLCSVYTLCNTSCNKL